VSHSTPTIPITPACFAGTAPYRDDGPARGGGLAAVAGDAGGVVERLRQRKTSRQARSRPRAGVRVSRPEATTPLLARVRAEARYSGGVRVSRPEATTPLLARVRAEARYSGGVRPIRRNGKDQRERRREPSTRLPPASPHRRERPESGGERQFPGRIGRGAGRGFGYNALVTPGTREYVLGPSILATNASDP
jgi:hypothetical protein